MSYIIIETFGGAEYATIVTEENGQNKVFEEMGEAEEKQPTVRTVSLSNFEICPAAPLCGARFRPAFCCWCALTGAKCGTLL